MDSKLIDYVISHTDKKFDLIEERFGDLEKKLDSILQFKWQVVGGSIAISFMVTLLFNVLMILTK